MTINDLSLRAAERRSNPQPATEIASSHTALLAMTSEHFADVLATPQDVERLNQTILDLAMRGKLTQQDPNDEPASKLIARIKAEKKDATDKSLTPISDDEKPFDLPQTWEWVRLADVCAKLQDGTHYSPQVQYTTKSEGRFLYLTSKNIRDYGIDLTEIAYIDEEVHRQIFQRCNPEKGDVLLTKDGAMTGTVTLNTLDEEFSLLSSVALIKPDKQILFPPYLQYFLRSPVGFELIAGGMSGSAIRRIVMRQPEKTIVALPPLAEQQRIVARIEQLFVQTRRLAELLAHAQTDLTNLNASALAHLLSAETPEEFERQWQFVVEHFDLLLSDPAHVAPLRQTILELAVRGKLTRQDANDEPASELLKRIQAEKARLVAEGKLGKSELLPPVTDDEKPFVLPKGWEWANWGMILMNEKGAFRRGPFGSSLTKSIFVESGYKVYEQYCAINDDCSFARYYITPKKFKEMKSFEVQAGDFLMSCSGVTLGRITQVPQQFEKGIINQALLRIRIDNRAVDHQYFLRVFRSPYFQKLLFDNSTGSAIPNVKGVQELKAIPIPIPPLTEQQRIVAKAEQLLAQCDALEIKLRAAQTNREWLVRSVMAGIAAG